MGDHRPVHADKPAGPTRLHGDAEEDYRRYPPGLRHAARWVRLCESQGTRLVDLIERWVEAAEEGNRQAERIATVAERIASTADDYLGTEDDGEE